MNTNPNISIIIPAGGSGVRVGGAVKKQFQTLADGNSILSRTLDAFLKSSTVRQIVVCLPAAEKETTQLPADPRVSTVVGGATRAASVKNGFAALSDTSASAVVLIHDGVRPYVSIELIERVAEATVRFGAVVPAIPVADTIKQVRADGAVSLTPKRADLRAAQTPQGFQYGVLQKIYACANVEDPGATDEAVLAEQNGITVMTVDGDPDNLKITTTQDLTKAKQAGGPAMRIGMGYDVHRLVEGRKCIIGGIEFEHDKGLLGHSDADVLLHAICDGLLGAANLGDLGELFPDNDPRFKDADSRVLLKECYARVQAAGYRLGNVDTVVVCERPKIKPRREEIKKLIASTLGVDENLVSVKATTEEKLGFTGREEGIAAWAYVSLAASAT